MKVQFYDYRRKIFTLYATVQGKLLKKILIGIFAFKPIQNCETGFKIQSCLVSQLPRFDPQIIRNSAWYIISWFVLLEIMHTNFACTNLFSWFKTQSICLKKHYAITIKNFFSERYTSTASKTETFKRDSKIFKSESLVASLKFSRT